MDLSYEVSGLVLPARIGGHPALDLCNTYAGWGDPPSGPAGDYLVDYAHLAQWCSEAGLVETGGMAALRRGAREHPGAAAGVLARTLALRSGLYAVLTRPARSRDHVAGLAVLAAAGRRAVARGTPVVGAGWRSGPALTQPLDACALAAVAVLTDLPVAEVHACPGDGCGWLFHDAAGRRRWCRMEWCGNRMKQRAHAARSRQSGHTAGRGPMRSPRS